MSGRSVSLVDGAPEVLVLGQDGALNRWRTGAMEQIAPPTGAGPLLDQALRAYHAADHLEILTADALWTYDLSRRVWSQRAFVGAPQLITQIDMQHGGVGLAISAWDGDGQLWAGFEDSLSGRIRFAHVSLPILPVLPFPAGDLRDMTVIRDEIVVLGGRQLLIYRKGETKARLEIALPDAIDGWRLQVDQTGSVLLVEGSELAPNAIHRLDIGQSGKRVLSDVAATYRFRDDHAHAFTIEAGEVELIRIDAQLATWRCGLSVGHEPACDLLSSPPLALAPEQVRAWDKNTSVLLTDTELLQLDDASRLTAAIDGPEVSSDGVLFRSEGALVFWEGPGRALWHIAGEDAERIVAQVDVLRQSSGQIQILADGKVLGISGAATISDALPDQAGIEAAAKVSHFIKSGMVWRLDDGRVMALDGALVSDPVLDFVDDARSILPLGRAPEGTLQWWLLEAADGSLVRIAATGCGDPEIGPPPPRSEEHTSELQSRGQLVCRRLLEKKKQKSENHSLKGRNRPIEHRGQNLTGRES